MKHHFYKGLILTLLLIPLSISGQVICDNGNFEDGTQNFTFRHANTSATPPNMWDSCNTNIITPYTNVGLDQHNEPVTLVSNTVEPFLSLNNNITNIRTTRNSASTRAIKLNPTDYTVLGNHVTVMSTNFSVNDNDIINVNFSIIMDYDNISPGFFSIKIFDTNNQIVDEICIEPDPNLPGFNSFTIPDPVDPTDPIMNRTIMYSGWVCQSLDVSEIHNQNATIEFMIGDCGGINHFSTAYIDDICVEGCTSPLIGDLNIDNINIECPTVTFDVCGNFDLPARTSLSSLSLNILDPNDNIISTIGNPVINGNDYCFLVNPTDFGNSPSGNFTFQVTLNSTSNTTGNSILPIIEQDGLVTFSDCSDPCDIITDTSINGDILSWVSSATSFDLEFVGDGNCCPNGEPETVPSTPLTYTNVTTNYINLSNIYATMNRIHGHKCFRYKIKTDCSEWSDWCCVNLASTNPNVFENPYNECYPNSPCEDLSPLTLTSPDNNINSSSGDVDYTNYASITASNKIESGYNSQYIASNFISLTEGFHAKAGSLFLARIQECVDIEIVPPPTSKKLSAQNVFNLKVYPNPAENQVNLSIKTQKIKSYILYDLQGKIIKVNTNVKDYSHSINVNDLSRGFYILKVTLDDNSVHNNNVILK